MLKKAHICILWMFCVIASHAQRDSIMREFYKKKWDEDAVDWLMATAFPYWSTNPELLYDLGSRALSLSEELDYTYGIARSHHGIGMSYWSRDLYDSAVAHYMISLEKYTEIDNKKNIANIKLNLGNVYDDLEQFPKALQNMKDAISTFETLADTVGLARSYNNLGVVFKHVGRFDSAIWSYKQSIEFRYYLNDTIGIARINNNVAVVKLGLDDPELALQDLNVARSYLDVSNDANLLGSVYANFGEAHLKLTNYGVSASYLDSAINLSREIQSLRTEALAFRHLSDLAKAQGQLERALSHLSTFNTLERQLRNTEIQRQIENLNLKYETAEKEKQLAILEQEKARASLRYTVTIISAISITILLILALYTLRLRVRNARLKASELKIQLEQKNKELTSYALNFIQKNELIDELSDKINEVKKQSDPSVIRELNQINKIVNDSSRIDQEWANFKIRFEEVHSGFLEKLTNTYSELGNAELRLCALLRLNMNLKESSRILGISVDSVKTARYRLRKKLNLNHGENLVDFLIKFDSADIAAG